MYQLRAYEKKGKGLMALGVTMEYLDALTEIPPEIDYDG